MEINVNVLDNNIGNQTTLNAAKGGAIIQHLTLLQH